MESGEQLASPSSTQSSNHMASSSASSSPAPAPAPPHMSSESRSLAPGPVGSPITSCGQLFQIGGDQHFSMSGLSGAFPLLSHPAFGLYSVNSGRSEFGGLGSLGLPAALASHPQLGTLPDWWRATEAHARGAASLFPPLLHLPPIFAPSFQTHNATPCPLQTPGKNRRAPAKGVNGTVKGASISPSSAVDYGNVAPFQAKLSVDRTKATNSSRGHKSSLDLNQVQQPTIQNATEKGLNKSQNALDTSSMSGSQSGSSVSSSDCDVSSDLDDLEDIDEDDGDLTNDSEDSEESRLKTELKELTPAESQMKRSAERVNVHPSASHLPLLSFQPTSHTSVIQATGSAAGNKPLATAAHPHREASVLPLKASPKALPLSSSSPKHFTPSASPKHFSYTSSPKRSSVSPLPLSLCASSMPPALSPLHKPKSSTPSPGRTQPGDSRNLNKISLQPHAFKLKQPFLPQDSFTPSFSPSPPKNQDVNKSLIKSPPRSSLLPPAKLSREAAPPLHGNHTNLFLSQSPNGVRMPGALQDVQDSPLALVTRPRGQSRVPSGKPPFSLPVNLSTGGKFAVAQSTSTSLAPTSAAHRPRMNKTSKAFRAGMGSSKTALSIPLEDPVKSTESDNPSSKDSDDSTGDEEEEDDDDDDDDDSDGSLSESESNLESDSDCSMDDTKERDETETDTDAEKALPKISKEAFSFHDPARLSPVNLQVAKPGVLPGSPPASVGANSSAALTFCCSPPASFTPAGNAKWRRVTDEQELRLPLQLGWQRETRIRTVAGRLQGEVAYYAPCGKKLRQYPDVMKYISRNGITKISRDNFSFSTKIKVGDFYEAREGPEGLQWSLLKEEDVLARIIAMDGRRSRHSKPEPQRTGGGSKSRKECPPCVSEPVVQDASEAKLQRKLKAQEIARQAAEIKMMRKLEKQEMARAAKEVRRQQAMMAAEERRKKKEEMKILKQQEKIKRIQQIRKEKELRAQQILEAKRKKKEEAANAKIVETEKRRKEKEMRRHQAVLLKHQELEKHRLDMERERRRQHLMLMKAMEARKKAEERERLKQEKKDEKRLNKERKLELRRLELEIAKELKKPNEDMCLADHKELPELSRIPGLFLPGGTFSDCLMVMQFLHSFGKVLGFDINAQVPDLHVLQKGLLNMGDSMGRVQDLLVCMLSKAVCDPGLPPGHKRKTALGDHLANVGINRDNVSEVLQLFMEAHCRHSELAELALSLKTNAFQAHKPSQKASILAFLVNELCCSKAVVSEIDKNIDYMTNLRKDKWVVEGKLRNLRSVYAKRTGGRDGTAGAEDGHTPGTPSTGRKRKRKEGDSEEEEDEDDDSEEQADDDDDDEEEAGGSGAGRKGKKVEICEEEDDGDQAVSVEELEKQIEKTSKQQTQIRRKLFESTSFLRSMVYGQDRYKRRYWVLPQCGGIFVEGMESAEVPEELEKERQRRGPPDGIRVKEEQPAVPSPTQSSDQDSVKDDFNLFLQKPGSFSKLSKLLEATKMSPDSGNNHLNNHPAKSSAESSPSYLLSQSAVSHAPSAPAPLAVSHLSCSPHTRAPGPSDHFLRALTEKSGHWFSLLPRSPCDDSSFTSSSSPQASCSSPRSSTTTTTTSRPKSPPSLSPNPLESAGINNLQLSSPQREVKPGVAQAGPPLCGWLSGAPSPNRPFPGSAPSPTLAPAYQLSEANGSSNPFLAHSAPSRRSETPDPPTDKPPGAPSPTVELSKNQDYTHPQPIPEEMMCGWWRVSGMEQLQTLVKALHSRGIREKALQKQIQKHMEYLGQACAKRKDVAVIDAAELEYLQVSEDTVESWCVEEQAMEVDIGLLQQVEELERRVALASLQIKGWMRPKPQSEREDLVYHEHKPFSALGPERGRHGSVERHPTNPLDIAVARLGELEQNIERRDEDPPPGMRLWRKALGEVRSSAQLSLCLQQLQKSIAWERSIMKAYCQLCQKGDNAELLLLCDGCDKGCHTYCHKPKITTIPEGDWFCPSCIAKVSGRSPQSKKQQSRTAGGGTRSSEVKRNRRLVAVGELYEEGPASPSSTSGTSTSSSSGGSSRSSKKGSRDSKKRKAGESSPENQPKEESPVCCVKKPKTAKDNTTKDLAMCRVLLVDLESHQDAWPFLTPVNHKDVPGYKKVIKRPMDFSTIREKLLTNQYVTLEMFIIDVNLVFDNCEKFNEDNSDIGRAGHSMRKFFEKRWTDLLKETF